MAEKKNPAAVALGRKGGQNSRKNLTDEEKKELGQRAARARWGPKKTVKKTKAAKTKKEDL
jgi:hypothetical protein